MSQLFFYFSLALIPLWTARLARNKGQNHWVWGGASVVLTFIPQLFNSDLNVLGMVPIIVLMFVKAPKSASDAEDIEIICSRCQTSHTPGHNFCVNCGWEQARLNRADTLSFQSTARVSFAWASV